MTNLGVLLLTLGLVTLAVAGVMFRSLRRAPVPEDYLRDTSLAIRRAVWAFLRQEYAVMAVTALAAAGAAYRWLGVWTAVTFLAGATCSAIATVGGLAASTLAGVRTTRAAHQGGLAAAGYVAFSGSMVAGLATSSMVVLGLSFLYFLHIRGIVEAHALAGFVMGASCVSMFARMSGGVFSKSLDLGCRLVRTSGSASSEDDPRNPFTLSDQAGDQAANLGGISAEIFETTVGSVIATFIIAASGASTVVAITTENRLDYMSLPIVVAALGVAASACLPLIRFLLRSLAPAELLRLSTAISTTILLIGSFLAVNALELELGIFYAILLGAFAGVILYLLTEWYTSGPPVHRLAAASDAGSVSNLLAGVTVGMESTVLPVLTLCGAVLVAYNYAGVYGIGIAAVAMLTSCGAGISVYAMAPIADNALGIARFHRLGDETVRVASRLDSLGNTVAAVGKTCAIGTGALAAVALFSAYARAVGLGVLDLADPTVVVGLLLGGAVPFVIGDAVLSSSGKVAFRLLGAVRRFFEESPAPQYSDFRTAGVRLARIAGRQSLREMALPAFVALGTPVGVGLVLGRSALGGTLAGVLLSGFLFALFMVQAGAAWDNAKALLERETEGRTHSAGVLGDTFGDPLKDAVGPSVNVVIRLMATVALLMAPWLR